MDKEELIKHCRYYRGEKENPFGYDEPNKAFFWSVERMYVNNAMKNDTWCRGWERDAQHYIDTHPNEKNIYTDKNVSIHTKGMAIYIENMSAKWCPYNRNKIFDY